MATEKKGLVSKFLEGSEKTEEVARASLPTNRWQAFFDILRGSLSKLCIVNMLMLLFALPLLLLIIMRGIFLDNGSTVYPFGANLGIGYPAAPDMTGVAEGLKMNVDVLFFAGFFVTSFIAAVGLAGGAYVIRNMIWTEGIFVAHDFWKGIGKNYVSAMQAATLCTFFLFLTVYVGDMSDAMIATGIGSKLWLTVAKVVSIIAFVFIALVSLWVLSLGISYKQGFWTIYKNAFIISVGTFPQTIFFALLAISPAVFFLIGGSFFNMIVTVFYVLLGISFALLVWLSFTQWAYDQYVNPSMGIATNRGLFVPKEDTQEDSSEALKEYRRSILAQGRSNLAGRPMQSIDEGKDVYELPTAFSREDLARLRQSRKEMIDEADAYAEEHKTDARYAEYNKMWDEREKVLKEPEEKKGKRKKLPKMLGE